MQNYIPFETLIKQTFEKTFFIVQSGSKEFLVPASIIGGENDKFYRLDDFSKAVSTSIIYQKENNETVSYVDLNSLKAKLSGKELTIGNVLADLESTLTGMLFKNLVDTTIGIVESLQNQTNNENGNSEQKPNTEKPQTNKSRSTNQPRNYNGKKYYSKKTYGKNYKKYSKSDKS